MAYKRISPQPVVEGGTGATTLAAHGVLLGEGTSAITPTAVGTNGQVLIGATTADPGWVTPTAGTGLSVTANSTTHQYALSTPVSVANGGTGDTSLTAYAVLCGGTTSTNPIQSVASVGTSGQVLTSNGAASLPTFQSPAASSITITGDSGGGLTGNSFTFTGGTTGLTFAGAGSTETLGGTLVVSNGGTGRASSTAYAVICGGTTSTGAQQSIASVGTSGQVLTSNGAGALPTFQTASTGITTINGNSGSVTGSTVTISANSNSGTAKFSAAGTTLQFSTEDGSNNVGFGISSLASGSFTGSGNCALGHTAGFAITSGSENVALGHGATSTVTTGSHNIGIGTQALGQNGVGGVTTGSFNIGIGEQTAVFTGGASAYNVIIGYQSGGNLSGTRSSNVYLNNGSNGSAESNAFRVGSGTGTGNQNINSAFVCGIQGITVTGTAVLISSSDQLGIAVSSRRFKSDIQDMKEDSSALYKLRPVSFVWDRNSAPGLKDATDLRQYGLIAEEAAPIIPHAVNLDKEGNPLNINYQDLIGMMVNEIQKLRKEVDALKGAK